MTWIKDANGNHCSVERWGSKEAAQKALDSLKNCSNCSDCSDCSDCSYCSYCSNCSYCSYCSDCSYCSYCSDCSYCSRCSYCSYCSNCSRCSNCSYCSYCSDCSYCSRCSYCSDCSRCSYCSYCSHKKDKKGALEPIVIPAIENVHSKVYAAVSQPDALDMCTWHTCNTTHCRGGWIVSLAGVAGKKLEAFFNTELAAMLIYKESGYEINPCRFYDSDEAAMADMKRLAEEEQKKP